MAGPISEDPVRELGRLALRLHLRFLEPETLRRWPKQSDPKSPHAEASQAQAHLTAKKQSTVIL